jgi:tetratricopeptide (TPR) repeat protein
MGALGVLATARGELEEALEALHRGEALYVDLARGAAQAGAAARGGGRGTREGEGEASSSGGGAAEDVATEAVERLSLSSSTSSASRPGDQVTDSPSAAPGEPPLPLPPPSPSPDDPESAPLREARRAFTMNQFFLAQVYGSRGDRERSAAYVLATLALQLETDQWAASDWLTNCVGIADYFSAIGRRWTARVLLECALKFVDWAGARGASPDEDVVASLHAHWGQLHLHELRAAAEWRSREADAAEDGEEAGAGDEEGAAGDRGVEALSARVENVSARRQTGSH